MTLHSNKLLCVGGEENGKFIENIGTHEVYPDGFFLKPETYKPKTLINPRNNKEELFYVLNDLTDSEANEQLLKLLNAENNI
ncbi:hypothetical protein ABB173_02765 [Acinetobacter baumannii]|uniref:hypothetical protein n=1 Tax=Acinetobacter baumannii TaxID=470 RepID=UPI002340FDC0|nr:hypothetical protein [Acinetobacter baumannii]